MSGDGLNVNSLEEKIDFFLFKSRRCGLDDSIFLNPATG